MDTWGLIQRSFTCIEFLKILRNTLGDIFFFLFSTVFADRYQCDQLPFIGIVEKQVEKIMGHEMGTWIL